MIGEQVAPQTIRVVYSGRVQGVGFRAASAGIARRFPVVGYVRNQPDGTVELVARGPSDAVQGFLDAITRRFQSQITNASVTVIDFDEVFESFEIRH